MGRGWGGGAGLDAVGAISVRRRIPTPVPKGNT